VSRPALRRRPMLRMGAAFLLLTLMLGAARPALAQTGATPPWQAAETLRSALFSAQAALLADDSPAAQAAVTQASAQAAADFASEPQVSAALQPALTAAQTAAAAADAPALALARGQAWSALMSAAMQQAIQTAADGQADAARAWLLVRDYRSATRFTRPNANATLALAQLEQGTLTPAEAAGALRSDLLDGYQTRLDETLNELKGTSDAERSLRRAEAAGLASGYWSMLAPAYAEQNGAAARASINAAFDRLQAAARQPQGGASAAQIADEIESALQNFRAAPLSPAEQARRASQLLRFIDLVAVEYGRGVKNGQVFSTLEVQEAATFMDGARTAFSDLRLPLNELDAPAAEQAAALLRALETDVQAANRGQSVADPQAIQAQTDQLTQALAAIYPPAWQTADSGADVDIVQSLLDSVVSAAAEGDYALAETNRLEAYAMFDSGLEQRLQAFAPDLAARAEGLFWQGSADEEGLANALARQAALSEVKQVRDALIDTLDESRSYLGSANAAPGAIVGNAAIIVLREGLEAVVILAALIASMVGASAHLRKPMLYGSFLALGASVLTWMLAQGVLSSLAHFGERLEAVVSLIAIGVLLLITNWFFHKTYWKDWLAGFHQQKRRLVSAETGQFIGLLLLGFTSVYREGFETVLFLQVLTLEAGPLVVLEGVAIGLAAVLLVGLITFRLNVHLPYKRMLVVTGVLIGVVLVTMVGNTVHVMQAVGWLPISPLSGVTPPHWMSVWFGFYPTWQGILGQIGAAVFVIGSYILAETMQAHERSTRRKNRAAQHLAAD
jgi:high-affinity iron transporter